jgi:uncharacterized protein YdaU (DUF1376 family)
VRWYPHYPSDFLEGVAFLSLEECGAYIRFLDTLYGCDGSMPDNDQALARLWGCNARKARRLKGRLSDAGKIQAKNGLLTNRRVTFELNKRKTTSLFMQSLAQKRWNNKGTLHANAYAIPDTRDKKEGNSMEEVQAKYQGKPHTISPALERQVRGERWK